jgi:hypothetical protein
MEITKVNPPMFEVDNQTINEYELRTLQLEISKGLKPSDTKVTCLTSGESAIIHSDGRLSNPIEGYNLSVDIMCEMWFGREG